MGVRLPPPLPGTGTIVVLRSVDGCKTRKAKKLSMADEKDNRKDPWTRLREYVSDVRVEMRRVTWPGKQEIYGTTVMVIATTFLLGFYFWFCDQIFSRSVQRVLQLLLHRG